MQQCRYHLHHIVASGISKRSRPGLIQRACTWVGGGQCHMDYMHGCSHACSKTIYKDLSVLIIIYLIKLGSLWWWLSEIPAAAKTQLGIGDAQYNTIAWRVTCTALTSCTCGMYRRYWLADAWSLQLRSAALLTELTLSGRPPYGPMALHKQCCSHLCPQHYQLSSRAEYGWVPVHKLLNHAWLSSSRPYGWAAQWLVGLLSNDC